MRLRDDQELLVLSAGGDHAAFAELYDRHAESVARYLWAWFGATGDVQDLVQETFVTTWKKADGVRIVGTSALPWLLATAKNHARNHARKVARRRETFSGLRSERAAQDDLDLGSERLDSVRAALDSLSATDRQICELCVVHGLTYKQAAAEIGQTPTTVAKRLQRARARVKKAVLDQ